MADIFSLDNDASRVAVRQRQRNVEAEREAKRAASDAKKAKAKEREAAKKATAEADERAKAEAAAAEEAAAPVRDVLNQAPNVVCSPRLPLHTILYTTLIQTALPRIQLQSPKMR